MKDIGFKVGDRVKVSPKSNWRPNAHGVVFEIDPEWPSCVGVHLDGLEKIGGLWYRPTELDKES